MTFCIENSIPFVVLCVCVCPCATVLAYLFKPKMCNLTYLKVVTLNLTDGPKTDIYGKLIGGTHFREYAAREQSLQPLKSTKLNVHFPHEQFPCMNFHAPNIIFTAINREKNTSIV